MRAAVLAVAALALALLLSGCGDSAAPGRGSASPAASTSSAPASVQVVTQTYAVRGADRLHADVCTGAHSAPAPVLVLIHGGAMARGSRAALRQFCVDGARRGFVGVSIDYRLLPAAYPDQLADVRSALAWIREPAQVRRFRLDPSRVGLVGSSAGATLAAQLVAGVGAPAGPPAYVDRAVLLSGVYDLRPRAVPAIIRDEFSRFAGCASRDCARAAAISPLDHVAATTARLLVVGSEHEFIPAPAARRFQHLAAKSGVDARLLLVPGSDHAAAIPEHDAAVTRAMWAFLSD